MSPNGAPEGVLRRALGAAARLRFTLLFLAALLGANIASGSIGADLPDEVLEAWGIGHDALVSGEASRLVTGTFLSHDPDMLRRQLVFAGGVIGDTEWRRGGLRTAALFFGLDLVGTLGLLLLIRWSAGLAHLAGANDVGMSIGGFGLIGLAIVGWRRQWAALSLVLAAIGAKIALSPDPLADLGHVLAVGLGFALGAVPQIGQWARARGPARLRWHPPDREPGHPGGVEREKERGKWPNSRSATM